MWAKFLLATLICLTSAVNADEPLSPPTSRKILSPSGKCWVYTDAVNKTTTAYRDRNGRTEPLWEIPGWYRVAALAWDCAHFATGYDGVNLLPEAYDASEVMLSFYRNGVLIRHVPLSELIKDLSKLHKTASHWTWGHYMGLEQGSFYRVYTVDCGEVLFDMSTGMPIMQGKQVGSGTCLPQTTPIAK